MGEILDARQLFEARQCDRLIENDATIVDELVTREQKIIDIASRTGRLAIPEEGTFDDAS